MTVPRIVYLPRDVRSELPFHEDVVAPRGYHFAHENQHGAVSVRASDGSLLGVKPDEFVLMPEDPNDWPKDSDLRQFTRGGDPLPGGDMFVKHRPVRLWRVPQFFICWTREGVMQGRPGDWVGEDGAGGYYPIAADFHAANYVKADDAALEFERLRQQSVDLARIVNQRGRREAAVLEALGGLAKPGLEPADCVRDVVARLAAAESLAQDLAQLVREVCPHVEWTVKQSGGGPEAQRWCDWLDRAKAAGVGE